MASLQLSLQPLDVQNPLTENKQWNLLFQCKPITQFKTGYGHFQQFFFFLNAFNKDALHWWVNTFILCFKRFPLQINAVLLNFLFICESWKIKCISFHENIGQHNSLTLITGFLHIFHFKIPYFSRLKFPNLSVDFHTIFNNWSIEHYFQLYIWYIVQSSVNIFYFHWISRDNIRSP